MDGQAGKLQFLSWWPRPFIKDDPVEQMYQYEVKMLDIHFKGGKIPQKDPEEGTPVVEENTKKDKKPAGKKDAKVEELSPEEEAKLKEEKAAKEKQNAERQKEWNSLNAEQQFYRYAEDSRKEFRIQFPITPAQGEDQPEQNAGIQEITLNTELLKTLENSINHEKGMYVSVEKLIPKDAEEPVAKGGKAAKGKGP